MKKTFNIKKYMTIKNLFIFLIVSNFLMTIWGFVFYVLTDYSASVLFDALYTGVMAVSSLIIYILKYVWKPKLRNYPMGALKAENLFSLLKTFLLILVSVYFLYEACADIYHTSKITNADFKITEIKDYKIYLIYSSILMVFCLLNAVLLHLAAKKNNDSIIFTSERNGALMDMGVSFAIGFAVVLVQMFHPTADLLKLQYQVYISKAILIAIIVAILPGMFKAIIENINALMLRKTDDIIEKEKVVFSLLSDEFERVHVFKFSAGYRVVLMLNDDKLNEFTEEDREAVNEIIRMNFKGQVNIQYSINFD